MSKNRAAARSFGQWDRLVDEWLASGQRQSDFAEAKGINPKTFQGRVHQSRKRRGLVSKVKEEPVQFLEVTTPEPLQRPLKGECRITLSSTQIEFSSSSDTTWIGEILSRLGHSR